MQFATHGSPTMHLKVPIQICSEGSDAGIENARARSVEDMVLREAADIWASRSVAPPSFEESEGESRNNSVTMRDELPPDYSAFARPGRRNRSSVAAEMIAIGAS
jgi:hypothetical protein